MEKKKASSFIFSIIAIILGVTLYKQFDFKTFRFKETGIAIVYLIAFAIAMYVLIKNWRNKG
jgi:multisubunit Na+/H+ antiporter MnhG subunit